MTRYSRKRTALSGHTAVVEGLTGLREANVPFYELNALQGACAKETLYWRPRFIDADENGQTERRERRYRLSK